MFGMRLLRAVRSRTPWFRAVATAGLVAAMAVPAAANSKYAGIVVDAKTGKTLYSSSADAYRYPASLTKIMTLYVLFEEMEAGRYTLNSKLKVSKYAAGRPPTKLGLKAGSTIKVKDAILGLVTKSANDASTAIAENISGSESKFAARMTWTARQLGMSKTTFRNPHGLPNSKQRTTARDMATLGRAIEERFPKYYKYFETRSFTYKGRRYGNHNKLLGKIKGVDGIKTGYTRASGFNLTASVKRDGRHIVAVVMGGKTGNSRNAQMIKLINRYLKKASRGPKTAPALVSRRVIPAFRAADLKVAPLPALKPGSQAPAATGAPVVLALAKPNEPKNDPTHLVTGTIPVPPKMVKNRMASTFAVAGLAPAPKQAPAADLVRAPATAEPVVTMVNVAPVPQQMPEKVADTVTVATSDTPDRAPGWQVQIAAAESETGAIEMLKKAKSRTGKALRKRVPYTEPVEANGQTLYRARFVGFETKTAALGACKTLKKAKFACYAIYQ